MVGVTTLLIESEEAEMKYTDILKTERLFLRPLTDNDFEAVHSWASNSANTRYMAWGPNTEEQTRCFLKTVKPGKDFAVVLKDSGKVIGSCGIYPDAANDTGELGWILHRDYWKHGYGTELGGELIRYGFEDLKLRRIFARCAAVNYGSYRVMERNHMRREALHVKAFWARVDKEWVDEAIYAILADEYKAATRLRLHIPNDDELEYRRSLIADENTMCYNNGYGDDGRGTYHQTPEQTLRWWNNWQSQGNFYAYVVRESDDVPVGEVNIHFPDGYPKENGVGWIGIVIEAKHRRNGYGESALKLLVDYAFNTLNLKKLLDDVPTERDSAIRIFERVGFKPNADGEMEICN